MKLITTLLTSKGRRRGFLLAVKSVYEELLWRHENRMIDLGLRDPSILVLEVISCE